MCEAGSTLTATENVWVALPQWIVSTENGGCLHTPVHSSDLQIPTSENIQIFTRKLNPNKLAQINFNERKTYNTTHGKCDSFPMRLARFRANVDDLISVGETTSHVNARVTLTTARLEP